MAKARARTTKSKTSKKTPAKKKERGALPVKAARAALDRATQDIKKLQRGSSKNAWAIGRRLAQVAELGLHRARGYSSIDDYAEKQLKIAADTAYLYMRVAQAFSETMTATFGTEKLDRALRYIAATPEKELPSDIPKMKFRVPSTDGNGFTNKSFEQVTISDLRAAVVRERAGAKKAGNKKASAPDWLDEEAAQAIDKSNKALDKAVGRNATKAADVTVRRDGKTIVVDVRGVPIDRAAKAFGALSAALK